MLVKDVSNLFRNTIKAVKHTEKNIDKEKQIEKFINCMNYSTFHL
jgi:hypothetical protein